MFMILYVIFRETSELKYSISSLDFLYNCEQPLNSLCFKTLSHMQMYFEHDSSWLFWKHCGARRKVHEAQFLLFPNCFDQYSISVLSYVEIFNINAIMLYTYWNKRIILKHRSVTLIIYLWLLS